jgi:hypothetical protein
MKGRMSDEAACGRLVFVVRETESALQQTVILNQRPEGPPEVKDLASRR